MWRSWLCLYSVTANFFLNHHLVCLFWLLFGQTERHLKGIYLQWNFRDCHQLTFISPEFNSALMWNVINDVKYHLCLIPEHDQLLYNIMTLCHYTGTWSTINYYIIRAYSISIHNHILAFLMPIMATRWRIFLTGLAGLLFSQLDQHFHTFIWTNWWEI